MQKLLILKGLPGSGKSTWAIEFLQGKSDWVRVNKDKIREMMTNYTPKLEHRVILTRDTLIKTYLEQGLNVIVDDTNLHPKHEPHLREIAGWFKAEIEVKFFDTPLKECIARDLRRPISVGEKVIKKMYRDFIQTKIEKQNWIVGLPKAIIVDIDGTLALHVARGPYEASKCDTDAPNKPIVEMVKRFYQEGYHLLFVTGRDKQWHQLTRDWLLNNIFGGDGVYWRTGLYMRQDDDKRDDSVVKKEIYENQIKGKYNIFAVFDDRNRVVEMWRDQGLTCLQVAEGDF